MENIANKTHQNLKALLVHLLLESKSEISRLSERIRDYSEEEEIDRTLVELYFGLV